EGMGFAAARQAAVTECLQSEQAGKLLANSNSILGVEYEKAIIKSGKRLPSHPLPLYRKDLFSANKIREITYGAVSGNPKEAKANILNSLYPYMTTASLAEFILALQQQEAAVFLNQFAPLLYSQSIWRDRVRLGEIQGMQGGLADRFVNHLQKQDTILSAENFSEWLASIATRSFPLSRVRRAFLSALLDIRQENTSEAQVEFLRVLGFSKRGQTLLGYMKDCSTLPVITRSADWQQVRTVEGIQQKELCFAAGNLWNSRLDTSLKLEETRQIVRI
ncbi:MAG: nucleotidyltransferase family protein, partial [Eubacteriales bacterium]|nr:nucleotidyltransferase family protein [Eubacteriales bacterium]